MTTLTKLASARACAFATTALTTLTTPAAQAQDTPPVAHEWSLIKPVSSYHPDRQYGIKGNGLGGGLRLGKMTDEEWEVGVSINDGRRSSQGNKIEQILFGMDATHFFSSDGVRPFISFGFGAEYDKRTLNSVVTKAGAPYASVAGGLRWMYNDTLGIQFDIRHFESFFRHASSLGVRRSGDNYAGVGLLWAFDGFSSKNAKPIAAAAPPIRAITPPAVIETAAPQNVGVIAATVVAAPAPAVEIPRLTLRASKLFALNSARLTGAVAELDDLVTRLNSQLSSQPGSQPDGARLSITGYTDQLGSETVNQRLSQQRAEAVKNYLVRKGVAAARLTAIGAGSEKLAVDCKEPTRAAMIKCGEPNRRVEIETANVAAK